MQTTSQRQLTYRYLSTEVKPIVCCWFERMVSDHLTIVLFLRQAFTGHPPSRYPTGQSYTRDKLTTSVINRLPSVAKPSSASQELELCMCTKCELVFHGKRKLQYHTRTRHRGIRFVCPQCSCTFVTNSGLHEHIRHIHQKQARYRCATCGKGYSSRANFDDHLAVHTGLKSHQCVICKNRFTSKCALKAHMANLHSLESARS